MAAIISLGAAAGSDTQERGQWPAYLKCEVCQAVAFQLMVEFSLAEQHSDLGRGNLNLRPQIMEMVINEKGACTPNNFQAHVVGSINGTQYLAGHGMLIEETHPLLQTEPMNITVDLAIRCIDLVTRYDTELLYKQYLENNLEHSLCTALAGECPDWKPELLEGFEAGVEAPAVAQKRGRKGKTGKHGKARPIRLPWKAEDMMALEAALEEAEGSATAVVAAKAAVQQNFDKLRRRFDRWSRDGRQRALQSITVKLSEQLSMSEARLGALEE
jgi:hypothetical protein